ncbi:uncharacterized protein BJ171DRAFT_500687 [Polychytrium aggregatum]|uniref:uncharacterized protein n=1 Tax=Polychytrium aggregatum TaxID=110093 RepID=UPI0022FECB77|nr:uncharacterized protein BJ171DRAFT_500687 [Polychytrium aggregatum]KAI9205522.1 hypothetical protein BJ171DRAFT_500687 [Polychytrium aggregatum]
MRSFSQPCASAEYESESPSVSEPPASKRNSLILGAGRQSRASNYSTSSRSGGTHRDSTLLRRSTRSSENLKRAWGYFREKLFTKKPSYAVSSPYNPTHLIHVELDATTGELTGLPNEWRHSFSGIHHNDGRPSFDVAVDMVNSRIASGTGAHRSLKWA